MIYNAQTVMIRVITGPWGPVRHSKSIQRHHRCFLLVPGQIWTCPARSGQPGRKLAGQIQATRPGAEISGYKEIVILLFEYVKQ